MNGSVFRGGLARTMACAIRGGLYVVSKAVIEKRARKPVGLPLG